ncbi:MAG: helix-turn-helix transcriptional regulator [Anaerolineaceae bacterium]|nr:helix-turn-helix transcriptional regulator [Anaerolineaceae bacterium]
MRILRLRGWELFSRARTEKQVKYIQDVAKRVGVNYQTAHRWITKSDQISSMNFDNISTLMISGFGFTEEQFLNMRIGDVFEFIETKEQGSGLPTGASAMIQRHNKESNGL